jgi:hypothetical protein
MKDAVDVPASEDEAVDVPASSHRNLILGLVALLLAVAAGAVYARRAGVM